VSKAFKPAKRKRGAPGHDGSYRKAALKRLRLAWEVENPDGEWEPENEPEITSMLKCAEGGLSAVLGALRAYDKDDAQSFIRLYDNASASDRKVLPIEAVAFACGIGSVRLAGLAAEALVAQGHTRTQILMGSSMHKVMKSTIKAATDEVPIVADTLEGRVVVGKTNGDTRAMEMFHKMTGFLPTPKGAQIAIQNVYSRSEDRDEGETPPQSWRGPDERLREIYAVTEQKALQAPTVEPPTITGKGVVEFEHARG
jgi:hypothetical protein